jgi:magnesium-transporting ATPase (P-type)
MSVDFGMLARMLVNDLSRDKQKQNEHFWEEDNKKDKQKRNVRKIVTCILIYVLTFVLVLLLRKNEFYVFVTMFTGLVLVGLLTTVEVLVSAIALGISMTIASYICVQYFKMWKHNFTRGVIPYWMPVAWSLVGVLGVGVYKIIV